MNHILAIVAPTLKFTVISASIATTFFGFVGYPSQVDGKSMNPTLKDSDWVFTNRWSVFRSQIYRGDIVIFISHRDPQRHIIKRVIGLEGDIVRNDKYSFREVVIPQGYCWVEGDNTVASVDSIKYGPIPLALIYAKATHIRRPWKTETWNKLTANNTSGFTTTSPPISVGGTIVVPSSKIVAG